MAEVNGNRTHPGSLSDPALILKTRGTTKYLSPPHRKLRDLPADRLPDKTIVSVFLAHSKRICHGDLSRQHATPTPIILSSSIRYVT